MMATTGGTFALSSTPGLKVAAKHFERRQKAARAGDHFPSEEDLLLGMPFVLESLQADVREFTLRLERRLRKAGHSAAAGRIIEAAQQLSVDPCAETLQELLDSLTGPGPLKPAEVERTTLRARIYQACLGDAGSALALASEMGMAAFLSRYESDLLPRLAFRALNLLCLGGVLAGGASFTGRHKVSILAETSKRIAQNFHLEDALRDALAPTVEDETAPMSAPSGLPAQAPSTPGPGAVVVRDVGNAKTTEGRRVVQALDDIVGKALPFAGRGNGGDAWRCLAREFPYASDQIDEIFRRLKDEVRIVPTILVGAQGSGKSRFARRLAFHLGLPFDNIQFGGMSDSSIMGTARRFSTGEPSIALAAIQRHRVANPAIILDEIEKASDGGHNGNALHALLGMLEPDTAAAFHDPWVQAPVNIGHVSWLITANSLKGVSTPLRDRCRIIRFPSPGLDDLRSMADTLLAELAEERGDRTQLPLDGVEFQAVRATWTDRSLRTLKKMIEHILDDRDRRFRETPM